MTILVTGATGFTGHHLAQKLFQSGHETRVLVRDKNRVHITNDFDPEIYEGDIRDPEAVLQAAKNCEKIFHVAAMYRTAGAPDQVYYDIHVTGTKNLLEAAVKCNVEKFIHCSTVGVHGDIDSPPANEESAFKPGDIYQTTKLEGELLARKFSQKTGLPVSVIRPTAIYGPGDLRLLKLFKLALKPITPILGDGQIHYHMVYIDDLVDAFLLAGEKPEADGETFIIGGGEVLTLNNLIDLIAKCFHAPSTKIHLPAYPFQLAGTLCEKICAPLKIAPPIYRRRVDFFTKSRSFDITKAKKTLNYRPKYSIREGIAQTGKWYMRNGYL